MQQRHGCLLLRKNGVSFVLQEKTIVTREKQNPILFSAGGAASRIAYFHAEGVELGAVGQKLA